MPSSPDHPVYRYHAGSAPLLITVPHAGVEAPEAIAHRFTEGTERLADTDWHVDRLYDFAKALGAHLLVARYSRYVIDLNRPEDDTCLYPGKFTTGLVPLQRFDRQPVYRPGEEPDAGEIQTRIRDYWQPYHTKIAGVLAHIRQRHGHALLFDAHSIASRVPAFFEGELPVLNLGTADGASCRPERERAAVGVAQASGYSWIVNGRFKGGYTTRHYGRPGDGIEAIQLELAQSAYMEEDYPFKYRADRAERLIQQALTPLLIALSGAGS